MIDFANAPDHIATGSEALTEFAYNAGADNLEKCWILSDWDVWVKNPHYCGELEPHPESYESEKGL